MGRKLPTITAISLMSAGLLLTGYGLMTPIKAWLSVQLLDHAWSRVLAGEEDVRPWLWMDSEPVARLFVPTKTGAPVPTKMGAPPESGAEDQGGMSFVVMRGVSGSVLAFAPGWHEQTDLPGDPGTTLISAHRDTHFAVLQGINKRDRFMIEDRKGKRHAYEVSEIIVTEQPTLTLSTQDGPSRLLLVTCYPLNEWHPNSRQRLVVVADAIHGV